MGLTRIFRDHHRRGPGGRASLALVQSSSECFAPFSLAHGTIVPRFQRGLDFGGRQELHLARISGVSLDNCSYFALMYGARKRPSLTPTSLAMSSFSRVFIRSSVARFFSGSTAKL